MSLFKYLVENVYLPKKARDSRLINRGFSKRPLPVLGSASPQGLPSKSLIEAINTHCGHLPYKIDPLYGLSDYYNAPEVSQYKLESKDESIHFDCDDLAVLAVGLARLAGVSFQHAYVLNLIINPWNQFTQAWANHVIAGFDFIDGDGKPWTAIIDTNSAGRRAKPYWYQGTLDDVRPEIIGMFSRIYRVNYKWLLEVPYPF